MAQYNNAEKAGLLALALSIANTWWFKWLFVIWICFAIFDNTRNYVYKAILRNGWADISYGVKWGESLNEFESTHRGTITDVALDGDRGFITCNSLRGERGIDKVTYHFYQGRVYKIMVWLQTPSAVNDLYNRMELYQTTWDYSMSDRPSFLLRTKTDEIEVTIHTTAQIATFVNLTYSEHHGYSLSD